MNPVAVAAKGKGAGNLVRRASVIGSRYGLGPGRMERRLDAVLEIAARDGFRPTLPVTAAAAERHPRTIARYAEHGIEFAVHGLYHVDHSRLTAVEQVEQLGRARRVLQDLGVPATGFRAPYLRWNPGTLHALRENGFLYDTSQAVHVPIRAELETDTYRRVLGFYSSVSAAERPSLPRVDEGLVRLPCSIPDDEAALDRLGLSPEAIAGIWLDAHRETHDRGELLTLAVHPERIEPCALGIEAVLDQARLARPAVWIASLEEIARWWLERSASTVSVDAVSGDRFHVRATGPPGLTLLARDVDVDAVTGPWADGWVRVRATEFDLRASRRPFIGVSPDSAEALPRFLGEQGYVVETVASGEAHARFLRLPTFTPAHERGVLAELEGDRSPLLRLGRWPHGARSALALTGDVDALTIFDYALRFVGR